jgi:hypothetical protein
MRLSGLKTLSALGVGGAAALVLVATYRGAGREAGPAPDDAHAAQEAMLSARTASPDHPESVPSAPDAPVGAPAGPSRSERDLAWQTELRGASEPFRNGALLIAIRENGFVCGDITSAEQGGDPLGGWRVACTGGLTYLVAVGASGQLVVEPVPVGDNFSVGPFEFLPPEQRQNPLGPPNR